MATNMRELDVGDRLSISARGGTSASVEVGLADASVEHFSEYLIDSRQVDWVIGDELDGAAELTDQGDGLGGWDRRSQLLKEDGG